MLKRSFYRHYKQPNSYYMKVEIKRDATERVIWEQMMTDDLKPIASQYWLLPA